ncbi:hypothetical protein TNIN_427841 [Trichonephila inaurata madagascariensis]|uniref:Uncharacterized protein n=1 Tax=Trichonephila inaurata madagascariensis TaxID=2747483 RepID=A0A8X6XQ19_9ARAC|nr:hypothetical protein TNIN_427841 [Trichonephila inaurata madagascariensis]
MFREGDIRERGGQEGSLLEGSLTSTSSDARVLSSQFFPIKSGEDVKSFAALFRAILSRVASQKLDDERLGFRYGFEFEIPDTQVNLPFWISLIPRFRQRNAGVKNVMKIRTVDKNIKKFESLILKHKTGAHTEGRKVAEEAEKPGKLW